MKRSEYISRVVAEASRPGGSIVLPGGMSLTALFSKLPAAHTSEQLANVLADYEEAFLHVKWDPEEPEMPKRLWAFGEDGGYLSANESGLHGGASLEVLEAAADAYNRLQSGELVPLPVATGEMIKLIRERDNLQRDLNEARSERDAIHAENRRLVNERIIPLGGALHDIAKVAGVSDIHGPEETAARIISEIHELKRQPLLSDEKMENLRDKLDGANETIRGVLLPADVISKTRDRTVHYAIGPVRKTREEAERDLREWFDKERS